MARLKLTDEEVARYADQLTGILSYVEKVSTLDLEDVPATAQVTGLFNVTREDEIKTGLGTPDKLLECSPLPKVEHQIRIKRLM